MASMTGRDVAAANGGDGTLIEWMARFGTEEACEEERAVARERRVYCLLVPGDGRRRAHGKPGIGRPALDLSQGAVPLGDEKLFHLLL